MKKLSNLLAALVFASLVIFMSCGGSDGGSDPDPLDIAAGELTATTWAVSAVTNPVGDPETITWSDFTLTFTGNKDGGAYTTANTPEGFEAVWPASGTWTFGSDENTIIRDGLNMDADIAETALQLDFTIQASSASRTAVVNGDWVFIFSPQ